MRSRERLRYVPWWFIGFCGYIKHEHRHQEAEGYVSRAGREIDAEGAVQELVPVHVFAFCAIGVV